MLITCKDDLHFCWQLPDPDTSAPEIQTQLSVLLHSENTFSVLISDKFIHIFRSPFPQLVHMDWAPQIFCWMAVVVQEGGGGPLLPSSTVFELNSCFGHDNLFTLNNYDPVPHCRQLLRTYFCAFNFRTSQAVRQYFNNKRFANKSNSCILLITAHRWLDGEMTHWRWYLLSLIKHTNLQGMEG